MSEREQVEYKVVYTDKVIAPSAREAILEAAGSIVGSDMAMELLMDNMIASRLPAPVSQPAAGQEDLHAICNECNLPFHTHPGRLCDEFVSQTSSLAGTFEEAWKEFQPKVTIGGPNSTWSYDCFQAGWNAALKQSQPLIARGISREELEESMKNEPRPRMTLMESQPAIEPQLMDAVNWLMGCGESDFMKPEGAPTYWWRSKFAERAGLEYDPELQQFRKAQKDLGR